MRSNFAIQSKPAAPVAHLPVKHITQLVGFDRFWEISTDALVWDRRMPARAAEWLGSLPASTLPEGRYRVCDDQVGKCMRDAFAAKGLPLSPSLHWLSDDVQGLASRVAELLETSLLRLRLEPVSDNACSKFHIDKVAARLICTYRGPGTQICVDPDAPQTVESIATGHPILLKGRLWPQSEPLTLKHRSPPISGTGITRWMIVIEAAAPDDGLSQYDQSYPQQA